MHFIKLSAAAEQKRQSWLPEEHRGFWVCSTKCSDQELLVNAHELGHKSYKSSRWYKLNGKQVRYECYSANYHAKD
jgi:hypothetical protein